MSNSPARGFGRIQEALSVGADEEAQQNVLERLSRKHELQDEFERGYQAGLKAAQVKAEANGQ